MEKENGTILVIARDREMKSFLTRFLAERFNLITALNGEGGLCRLSQVGEIDLILLEQELSDMDGLAVLRSIRKTHPKVPVAFVTGNDSAKLVSEVVECGITAYLMKPVAIENVEKILQRILNVPHIIKSDAECARDFIEEHYTENLTVSDIVAVCGVGYRQIARKFKRGYGCSMMEFVKRTRVERAKELLIEGRMRVCEIADAVGFSNSKTFGAIFKSLTGMTPGQFQETAIPPSPENNSSYFLVRSQP